jgi:hypothetical protein
VLDLKLVGSEALTAGKERFHVIRHMAMVLRTLKGQEIEYYEFLTAIIRGTHFTTIYSSENEKD